MIDEFSVTMMEREAGASDNVPAMLIKMWMGATPNARKSKLAGHPVYEEVPHIEIMVPGEQNKSFPSGPATEVHLRRFPRTYDALMKVVNDKTSAVEGMPIETWPQVTRAMAMTLRASNIPTVEALAEVRDEHVDKIGTGGRELRSMAKAFLMVSKDAAAAQQIKAESDRKDLMLADMQRQIKELAAKLENQDEEPRRGPGRPRKVQEDAA